MKTFLIKNRYNFNKYLQNFLKNQFGIFLLTPMVSELRQFIKQDSTFLYQLALPFLNLILKNKNQKLFTSLVFFISFSEFLNLISFLDDLNKKKFNYEICFFKINNFFISLNNFKLYQKVIKNYQNFNLFYVYFILHFMLKFIKLFFQLIFQLYLISFIKIFKNK